MNTKSVQNSTIRKKNNRPKNEYSNVPSLVKRQVLGIGLTNATTEEVLEYLVNSIQKTKKNLYVVTPNPEMLVLSRQNKDFKEVLNNADLALTDGMQLFNAARFLGKPLKERMVGTDFVEKVCEKVQDWPITVGFLGAGPGVAEKAAECLINKYPGLKVVFVGQEWPEDKSNNETSESRVTSHELSIKFESKNIVIRNSKFVIPKIDVLFVAFGAPKQELWMAQHLNTIPVRVMIGVGGAFDQIVDPSLRPPTWMHSLGLGWLYRLLREPWRIGRQLKLLEFIGMVVKEKLYVYS